MCVCVCWAEGEVEGVWMCVEGVWNWEEQKNERWESAVLSPLLRKEEGKEDR